MSIDNNFPFDKEKNEDGKQEILPFIKVQDNFVSPNEIVEIIPKNIIPLTSIDIIRKDDLLERKIQDIQELQGLQELPDFIDLPETIEIKEIPEITKILQMTDNKMNIQENFTSITPTVTQTVTPQVSSTISTSPSKNVVKEDKSKILENELKNVEKESIIINPSILRLVNTSDRQTISNPVNILAIERSNITTNPFIPNEQKIQEFEMIDHEANEIIKKSFEKNNIYNYSINEINKKISISFIGFLDDLFIKPEKDNWIDYLQIILLKEERYVYFGFLLIIFVIYTIFIE